MYSGQLLMGNSAVKNKMKIFGSGEMADLTRDFDWSATPLGPVEQWPDALLVLVNTLLANRQPMLLFWGPELIQFYNDAFRPSLGSDKHPKAVGQRAQECWSEIWEMIWPQIDAVMGRGEACWFEDQLVPFYREGRLEDIYWTYSYSPVRDPEGVIRATLVTCSETTGRVQAEQALRESEERLSLALSVAHGVGTWDWDVKNDRIYADTRFALLYGVDPKVAKAGAPAAAFKKNIHPDDLAAVEKALNASLSTGEDYGVEYRLVQADHSVRWVASRGRCILSAEGAPLRFPGITFDISDRKKAEEALRQNEKLAAVGRLAASIAHEINNPLEAVTNLIYLSESAATSETLKEYLAAAQQELTRVTNITTQTLRFHRQSTRAVEVSLKEIIESVLALFQRRIINAGIRVQRQYRTERKILAYEGDLRQVIANLISNALDASENDGRIMIRVREGKSSSCERRVILTIADAGSGMSAETRRRMFEAFFTTKSITGTGLGLWVSAEIIANHHAAIRVRSTQDAKRHGTAISISFPERF
jgi:PAS domain S-box-containing protein